MAATTPTHCAFVPPRLTFSLEAPQTPYTRHSFQHYTIESEAAEEKIDKWLQQRNVFHVFLEEKSLSVCSFVENNGEQCKSEDNSNSKITLNLEGSALFLRRAKGKSKSTSLTCIGGG